ASPIGQDPLPVEERRVVLAERERPALVDEPQRLPRLRRQLGLGDRRQTPDRGMRCARLLSCHLGGGEEPGRLCCRLGRRGWPRRGSRLSPAAPALEQEQADHEPRAQQETADENGSAATGGCSHSVILPELLDVPPPPFATLA